MPRYPFCCPTCGLTFEVSRRMDDAGGAAHCPEDGALAARVFTTPQIGLGRPPAPRKPGAPKPRGYSHHGHSHGAGTGAHSHGPAPRANPGA